MEDSATPILIVIIVFVGITCAIVFTAICCICKRDQSKPLTDPSLPPGPAILSEATVSGSSSLRESKSPTNGTNKDNRKSRRDTQTRATEETNQYFPQLVPYRLNENDVLTTRRIATGGFGTVWLGHYHGEPIALKKLQNMELNASAVEDMTDRFANEIQMMAKLQHPKLVRFIGCTWSTRTDLAAVSEFMSGGDVRMLLENQRIQLSWTDLKMSIAIDICEALVYLHTRSPPIIHRDMKSSNVMLNVAQVAKLSDFGLCRHRTFEETQTANVGTVRWAAPEIMLSEDYSERADVYSFGVVLSELDTRVIPFENRGTGSGSFTEMDIPNRIARGELLPTFSEECPEPIFKLAHACLQFDPELRPSTTEILERLQSIQKTLA